MKRSFSSSLLALSALTGSLLLATSPLALAADGVDSQKAETVGVFSGLVLGGLVGGPPGAIISAAAGGWVGEQLMIRKNHRQLQAQLAATEAQMMTLQSTNATLQSQQLALQKRLYERELVASTAPPSPRTAEAQPGETVLHFRSNSPDLEPHYRDALLRFVEQSKAHPSQVIEIIGHADRRGDPTTNLLLSQHRVEAVLKQLRALGLESATYQTVAFGEQQPVTTNAGREQDFFDRRVVLRLQDPKAELLSSNQQ
jgi:sortase system peptidoglycan-associated protein